MGLLSSFIQKSECSICGKEKNILLLQNLYDGKICQNCVNKIGFDGDIKTISCKEASQRCLLYDKLKSQGKISKMPPFPYMTVESYEESLRKDKYIYTAKYKKLSEDYYKNLPSIDSMWSVLYNLKDFTGKNAEQYEKFCLKNIATFKQIYDDFCVPYHTTEFTCVPAYKRLSMLYEKQKKYQEAALICIDAIQHGAINEYGDGGTGKMYARLARMAKKAGMIDSPEVKSVLIDKNN